MMMPNYARQVSDLTNLFNCCVDNISSYPQNKGEPLPKRQPLIEVSDCQGFQNPCGLRVGYAGVRVRVGFIRPSLHPYPCRGLAGYPPSWWRVFVAEFESRSTRSTALVTVDIAFHHSHNFRLHSTNTAGRAKGK